MLLLLMAGLIASPIHAGAAPVAGGGDFKLDDHAGEYLDVLSGGKIVARYMDAYDKSSPGKLSATYKPYLHVFDPEGKAPITKGVGGLFTHHRGIFIGWMKITVGDKTFDRWHMKGGEQIHKKFTSQHADGKEASFTSLVDWTGETAEPIIQEERTFTFLPAPAPAYVLIDMISVLKAMQGETKLDGDPEHSGVQYRPAAEVDVAETTYVFPKANADTKKDRDYPWVGETYSLGGKKYSVVYMNHPGNPKGTVFSAYRDYGRFGGFFKTTIPKDGTLKLRVRFLVAEGEMPPVEVIQKAYNSYAGVSDPVPQLTVKKVESKPKAAVKAQPQG